MRRLTAQLTLLLAALLGISACGPSVERIDLHDPLVPVDARRLIADSEDGIAIAKARRDEARDELRDRIEWRDDILADGRWPNSASNAVQKLEAMADAEVDLAELQLAKSEAEVDLARAKFDLVTAKTAVRHDLAVYDLEPLRQEAEARRATVKEVRSRIADQRVKVEKLAKEWWAAYADFKNSNPKAAPMFVSGEES